MQIGIGRNLFSLKTFTFYATLQQQVLFVNSRDGIVGDNFFLSKELNTEEGKHEIVSSERSANLISQVALGVRMPLKKRRALFASYSYNQGWQNLLSREVVYNLTGRSGRAIVNTKGSGTQFNFGIAYSL